MLQKLSQTLNRALIKRVDLLPNVSEFNTHRLGIHEYAAVYGIEKVVRSTEVIELQKSTANFYLEDQAVRLTKLAAAGKAAEYEKLSEIIQRKSIAFRVLALNRTIDNWYTMPLKKLSSIWRSLSHIARTNSSELRFKRVWIDKKPGDYARPLGVPTHAWRCWSYMKMDHLERFYKASGQLASWQHGGRSGVGVLSCYKQLIPRITTENTIYEFDIKGFFDNISHESIINRIKESLGDSTSKWVSNILKATPLSYTMPPLEADKAYQEIKSHENKFSFDHLIPRDYPFFEFPEGDYRVITEKQRIEEGLPEPTFEMWPEDVEPYLDENGEIKLQVELGGNLGFLDDREVISYKDNYKDAMEGNLRIAPITNPLWQFPVEKFKEEDRNLGRDAWKNLGQPGKGVPQGLGTSPFLSTFLTDSYLSELKDKLIMYMDDGILFARNKAEMEKIIITLKECLQSLGLEIAPEKSKYVKVDGEWIDSIKFLGLRFLPEENTIMSDTRSGTKVRFPMNAKWDDVKTLAALNSSSMSNVREKFDRLINTTAYEAGLRYGFLGCLIAGSQYKDAKSMEERKYDIRKGQNSAWAKIEASKGFVWKFQDLHHHNEYLTNITSIQVQKFMTLNRKGGKLYHYQGRKHRQELLKKSLI